MSIAIIYHIINIKLKLFFIKNKSMVLTMLWWGRTDSNHRSESQQIYSLPPLATRELPHLELHVGVEPTTCWLQVSCSAIEPMKLIWWKQQGSNLWPSACKADALPAELCFQILMVTPRGIEPLLPPWKGGVLTAWPRGLGFCSSYFIILLFIYRTLKSGDSEGARTLDLRRDRPAL